MLLAHEHLTVQDADAVAAALEQFQARSGLSFSDCLVVEIARKAGHMPLGTFDRRLAQVEGAQRL
jgi:predicted nucleic-acid-binding protein